MKPSVKSELQPVLGVHADELDPEDLHRPIRADEPDDISHERVPWSRIDDRSVTLRISDIKFQFEISNLKFQI